MCRYGSQTLSENIEDRVLTTMKNNLNMKTKQNKINGMLIEVMATCEALTKNLFEFNLKKMSSQIHLNMGQNVMNGS